MFALARYNPDGSPDLRFGKSGFVITDFDGFSLGRGRTIAEARALVVEPDGSLVVAGFVYWNSATVNAQQSFALVRYKTDGSAARVFGLAQVPGQDSFVITGPNGRALSLLRQPDGKLVAAGYSGIPGTGSPFSPPATQFALARYNPDGTLDRSFGQNGSVLSRFEHPREGSRAEAHSLVLQPDGKLVAAGLDVFRRGAAAMQMAGLMRFNPDGSLDQGFGSGGKVETILNLGGRTGGTANALVLVRDGFRGGKLVVAGYGSLRFGSTGFALARYHLDGNLDRSFGRVGIVFTGFPPNTVQATALAHYQHRGVNQLVVAGHIHGQLRGFALARYNIAATREELPVP